LDGARPKDPGTAAAGPVAGIVGPEHLEGLLAYLTESVHLFDGDGDLRARLSAPGGMLGHDAELGTNVFSLLHPDDVPRGLQLGAEAQESQLGWRGEVQVRLRHADGTWRWFQLRMHNRRGDPELDGMVIVAREIWPDAPSATDGDLDDVDLGTLADDLPTAYLALGRQARIRHASGPALELLRCGRDDLMGLPLGELVVDRDRPAIDAAYDALLHTTGARTVVATTRTRFGGRVIEAELHTRGTDREHKVVTVVLVDHTAEPELIRLATRDSLTGLANRSKVLETIGGLLLHDPPTLSVVYVDLDDLKAINDRHGHETGDRALIAVAQRLSRMVRPADLVGRMSGDEFVLVCPGLSGHDLLRLVQRVGEAAADRLEITAPDGTRLDLTVSAGGATAAAGDTTRTLLRRADQAMFAAKHHRRR
jgi:diguanylate cyclase (GGDEF)-like protein